MTTYKTYSGYTSLQNDLIKLLNGISPKQSTKQDSDPEYTNDEEDLPESANQESPTDKESETKVSAENLRLSDSTQSVGAEAIISDAIQSAHAEEHYEIDTDINGGADIIGLVSNILEGGALKNNSEETIHQEEIPQINGGNDAIGIVENMLEGGALKTYSEEVPIEAYAEEIMTDTTLVRDEIDSDLVEGKKSDQKSSDNIIKNIVSEVLESNILNKETDGSEVITNIFLEENTDQNSVAENKVEQPETIATLSEESSSSEDYKSDDDLDDTKYAEIIKDIRTAHDASKAKPTLKGGSIKTPNNIRIINAYPWILKS